MEKWFSNGPGAFRHDRDKLLRAVLKFGLSAVGLYERGRRNALNPAIRKLSWRFERLPTAFCGFRLLHLSDLHLDGLPGLAEVVAERISELSVDACVLTGDYRFETYGPCHKVYPEMRKVIDRIRSRYGLFGILGNHDCFEEAEALERLGVRMLLNESVSFERDGQRIWMAGVDDEWDYKCADVQSATSAIPEGSFRFLLAHSPDVIEAAVAAGIDMYLCGHTHAGQIRLPGWGAVTAPVKCHRRFWQGCWTVGRMQGYTSAGIGCSLLPVRFWCPGEIAVIDLKCGRCGCAET